MKKEKTKPHDYLSRYKMYMLLLHLENNIHPILPMIRNVKLTNSRESRLIGHLILSCDPQRKSSIVPPLRSSQGLSVENL